MYSKNLANFLLHMFRDGATEPNLEDEIVDGTIVTREGRVVCGRVLEALGEPIPTAEATA
jgi:hypothetical protein